MKLRSALISTAALVVLLTAAAAQGLSGSNTVYGDDIVDQTITYNDLKDASLGGKKILDKSVIESKLADNAVSGRVLQDNAVDAASIQDGVIGAVDTNFIRRSTVSIDFDAFGAGTCQTFTLASSSDQRLANDVAVVSPPSSYPDALSFHTENMSTGGVLSPSSLILVACAHVAVDNPPAAAFDVVTFE